MTSRKGANMQNVAIVSHGKTDCRLHVNQQRAHLTLRRLTTAFSTFPPQDQGKKLFVQLRKRSQRGSARSLICIPALAFSWLAGETLPIGNPDSLALVYQASVDVATMHPDLTMTRLILQSQAELFAIEFEGTMFT